MEGIMYKILESKIGNRLIVVSSEMEKIFNNININEEKNFIIKDKEFNLLNNEVEKLKSIVEEVDLGDVFYPSAQPILLEANKSNYSNYKCVPIDNKYFLGKDIDNKNISLNDILIENISFKVAQEFEMSKLNNIFKIIKPEISFNENIIEIKFLSLEELKNLNKSL
jgi:hypothetical protein